MHSTALVPSPVCRYLIPNHFHLHHHRHHLKRKPTNFFPSKNQTHFRNTSFLTLSSTNGCSKEQDKKKIQNNSYPNHKHTFLEELYSFTDNNDRIRRTQNEDKEERTEKEVGNGLVIFANMWWADFRAAFGQRINFEGIVSSVAILTRDRHLLLPHVAVPDIRYIDWANLQKRGFKGVIFDKDNTITAPYSLTLWDTLGSSLECCKSVFGDDIAVFSNSAGLYEFDPDGSKARALEKAIGIKVLRHRMKKPAGTAEEIEKHFGCASSQLIMVGDRRFIDIVYGNRNGFLTILTEPLTLSGEPLIVKQVRILEAFLVKRWNRRGLMPTSHSLLPDALQCVKDLPPL
ncbi:hypothetical protein L1049_023602 [Liquidambar formosana]|uniref:Uncharacterized protein n=1 Tax=Liquidambar formosana TaxID=63359 RepID=A0AAP0RUQ6_LIQFO